MSSRHAGPSRIRRAGMTWLAYMRAVWVAAGGLSVSICVCVRSVGRDLGAGCLGVRTRARCGTLAERWASRPVYACAVRDAGGVLSVSSGVWVRSVRRRWSVLGVLICVLMRNAGRCAWVAERLRPECGLASRTPRHACAWGGNSGGGLLLTRMCGRRPHARRLLRRWVKIEERQRDTPRFAESYPPVAY